MKIFKLLIVILMIPAVFIILPKAPSAQPETGTEKESISQTLSKHEAAKHNPNTDWLSKSEDYWKEVLSPEQYQILRNAGTERAYTGDLWNSKEKGVYQCAACGHQLFSSETKYESGSGWPSFYQPVNKNAVSLHDDSSLFMTRVEIKCSRCGSHLGHVFDDGPADKTGKRYCINSAAIDLITSE